MTIKFFQFSKFSNNLGISSESSHSIWSISYVYIWHLKLEIAQSYTYHIIIIIMQNKISKTLSIFSSIYIKTDTIRVKSKMALSSDSQFESELTCISSRDSVHHVIASNTWYKLTSFCGVHLKFVKWWMWILYIWDEVSGHEIKIQFTLLDIELRKTKVSKLREFPSVVNIKLWAITYGIKSISYRPYDIELVFCPFDSVINYII